MHSCNQCGKTFTRGDNLKRHEKLNCTDICKAMRVGPERVGSGLLFTSSSSGIAPERKLLGVNDNHSKKGRFEEDDSDINGSEEDADTIAGGEDPDENDNSGGVDGDDDDYFWIIMHLLSDEHDGDILDIFKSYLALYTQSKADVLYLKIMEDVAELETSGMNFKQALAASIVKNKEAIAFKISNCGDKVSADDELSLWCKFVKERNEWGSWCKWFTGEDCRCEECKNVSIPKVVAWYGWVFHLMDDDSLVQEIDEDIEKSDNLEKGIILAVEKYREAILEEYAKEAEHLSDVSCAKLKYRGIGPVWRYIDDNE